MHLGRATVVKFPELNWWTRPEINGEISLVSADVAQDPKTGAWPGFLCPSASWSGWTGRSSFPV